MDMMKAAMRTIPKLMMTAMAPLTLLAPLLGGCGSNDSAEGPGGVTADEARALNDAAALLDARAANSASALANAGQGAPDAE